MKRIRFTTAAILLSAFLTATPVMATAPATSPADTQVKEQQQVTPQQSAADTKKWRKRPEKRLLLV